jgi:hypothetical protein
MLHASIYAEEVAGCGGNNVASLLIKHLHDSGLVHSTKEPGLHFITSFDKNCSGQNKNNFVLKIICAWLIEKGFSMEQVSVIFLSKGQNKKPS